MVEIEERLIKWNDIIVLGNVEVRPRKILSSIVIIMAENVQPKRC